MSYWVFTDIFEENGPPPTPFHGGFGLLNLQGIKKPAYFAYRFLNQLGATELKNADGQSWVCRDENGGVQILFWNLTALTDGKVSNQEVFRKIQPAVDAENVRLKLTHLPPGKYDARFFRAGFERNDAYTAYLKLGAPAQLTRNQVSQLHASASGAPEMEKDITVDGSESWETGLTIRANDVWLVKLSRH
jgi:xylan 1,4-beta-xylosidase